MQETCLTVPEDVLPVEDWCCPRLVWLNQDLPEHFVKQTCSEDEVSKCKIERRLNLPCV